MKVYHNEVGAKALGYPYTVIPCTFEDMTSTGWSEELKTVNLWCWEAFGEQGQPYDASGAPHRWYQQNGNFWFRDEVDVFWFRMRWA